MSDLRAIVYVSSAEYLLSPSELEHLLRRARERNAAHGITGFLMYCDGNFMQYIEGPSAELNRTYALICKDPLHQNLLEIVNEAVDAREFGGWSMAYATAQMPDFLRLSGAPWNGLNLSACTPRTVQGRLLLRDFWRQHGKPGL